MNNGMCDNERILVSFNDDYIKELTDFVSGFKRISKEAKKFVLCFNTNPITMTFIWLYSSKEGMVTPFTEAKNIPEIIVDMLDRKGCVLKRTTFHDCLINNKVNFGDDLIIVEFTYRDEELEDATTNEETNNEEENC